MSNRNLSEYAVTAAVRDVIQQIARNEIQKVRPASRLAMVQSVNPTDRSAQVVFVGESESVRVPYTSKAPAFNGQFVRVGGTTHDRYIEDVIGQDSTSLDLEKTKESVGKLMEVAYGEGWLEADPDELGVTLEDYFGTIGDAAVGTLAKNINTAVSATIEDTGQGEGDVAEAFKTIFDINRTTKAAEAAALEAKQILAAMNNQEDTGGDGMAWSTDFNDIGDQPLSSADWQTVSNIMRREGGGAGAPGSGSPTSGWAVTTRATNSNAQKCSFIISRIDGTEQESGVFVRANANLSSGVLCTVNQKGRLILGRASVSGGSITLLNTFLNVTHSGGFKVGDQVEVRCNGTFYYVYKNGKQIYSANDVNNVVPVGSAYRYCGMYMERELANLIFMYNSPRFASFYMSDWYIPPGGPVSAFWQGTLIQYNSLTTKLDNAVYFILPAT